MKCEAINTVQGAIRRQSTRTALCAEEATVRLIVTRLMYFDGSSDDETMVLCQKHFEQECESSDVEPEQILSDGWAVRL